MSDWLGWFGEVLTDAYDGDMDLVFAHIKKDGTVEFISTTHNDDDTFTVTLKNMSPFAFVAQAAATPDNPSTDDEFNLYVVIGMAGVVVLGTVIFITRKTVRK